MTEPPTLSDAEVEAFVADGFVRLEGAFDRDVGERCRAELWRATGYDEHDPATWAETLVRLDGFGTPPFQEAATTPALHAAFDRLVGPGRWLPRQGLGTFPLRFPGPGPAREAGWHVEASFTGAAGEYRVSLASRGRALLLLFLFSDVGPDDAPTLVRVGSHRVLPRFLADHGEQGREWLELCQEVVPATADLPEAAVTGRLGDVYLCHPFLVHSAQAHRGREPRFMAQPPLLPVGDLDLVPAPGGSPPTPVARAVLEGLREAPSSH